MKSNLPTRKWFVAQVAAAGTFLVALIQAGWELSSELQIVAVGLVVGALSTYLIPNEDTPGGVPEKQDNQAGQSDPLYLLVVLIVAALLVYVVIQLVD